MGIIYLKPFYRHVDITQIFIYSSFINKQRKTGGNYEELIFILLFTPLSL